MSERPHPSGPIRLLVVDDEPDLELLVRQKFRREIRDGRMAFTFADDGIEALERLEADDGIEIVLADINMPRMDGLTLLGRITELDRLMKVVIVSAYGDMENIRTAMNRGAFDFITKPIRFDDLTVTIERTHRELAALREAAGAARRLTALQRELEIASKIQLSMLPSAFPEHPAFDLHATMIPALEVGGDLYDAFPLGDDRLGFAVGDVSGKGVGSAIFMAITRTTLRATALRGLAPAACVREVNRVLFPESMPRMFVTLVYGVLDARTGEVTLCNAGHNRPYVVRRDGRVEAVDGARGVGVCLTGDFEYAPIALTLAPGDGLVLYTDGVTEAADGRGRFEEKRLEACLAHAGGAAAREVIRGVLRSVEAFTAGAPPFDDLTLLALRYTGNGFAENGT